jgi:hypothetical protein
MQFLKGIGYVFQENEPQNHVFVFGSIDVFSQFVCGFLKLLFNGFLIDCFFFGHKRVYELNEFLS